MALKLNADLSHFVVGLERLPSAETDPEFFPQVWRCLAAQAWYIHAWVASPQQIQIDVAAHMGWWRAILSGMAARGVPLRVCPEFGPVPYLPVAPCSHTPLAELEGVVLRFADRLRKEL
jgi:hypothetical protein